MNTMFDETEIELRFGDYKSNVNFSKYHHLRPVESYLQQAIEAYPTHCSHDVECLEHPYFDTIGYRNFSDFLSIRPLQPDLSANQITEALIYGDSDSAVDFYGIYADRLASENMNKYATSGGPSSKLEATVALIGQNKAQNMCVNKLRHIYATHGKLAAYKPHPLTGSEYLENLHKTVHRCAIFVSKEQDVYSYIARSEVVYTSHWSETAFHALCMGKQISPIDTFQSRQFASFSHFNAHLFETDEPRLVINRVLNDYRSGFVHPKYHPDWRDRIDRYLDYIHAKRQSYRFKYV